MTDIFLRTEMLLGRVSMKKLKDSKVLIFGLGGVGSYTALAIARSGVGKMVLVDNDTVSATNINRQALAFQSTIGRYKTEVMREILLDINPELEIEIRTTFVLKDNVEDIITYDIDYIVDAIDTVTAKLTIAEIADREEIPLISCMGTGNKLGSAGFCVTDISKTHTCGLAKAVRKGLRDEGIEHLDVLFSTESVVQTGQRVPSSIAYTPSVAGIFIAEHIIKRIISE